MKKEDRLFYGVIGTLVSFGLWWIWILEFCGSSCSNKEMKAVTIITVFFVLPTLATVWRKILKKE